MSTAAAPSKSVAYQRLRRKAHERRKRDGIEFEQAFHAVAQEAGYRDAIHAIRWLIPQAWWGPCDPPTPKDPAQ